MVGAMGVIRGSIFNYRVRSIQGSL
jgi:hypothetical protein